MYVRKPRSVGTDKKTHLFRVECNPGHKQKIKLIRFSKTMAVLTLYQDGYLQDFKIIENGFQIYSRFFVKEEIPSTNDQSSTEI